MKTENKNMRIVEPGNTIEEREVKGTRYRPVQPVVLNTIPKDAVSIRSTGICKLLNISNLALRSLRAERAIPPYKLGGTFLYSKEGIMNYLVSNYSRRI